MRFATRRSPLRLTGTEDFRLRQYDGSRGFGYIRPSVVRDGEEDDSDNKQEVGNWNGISHQPAGFKRIKSGTAMNELNMYQFRSLLVENFNIRFHENDIQWPRRLGGAHVIPRHVPIKRTSTLEYYY